MSATFDPYYKWLAIPPSEQPPNYYRLLALAVFESDADVIATAADQRMAHVRSFQGGQYVDASQRLLNELAAARICLLRPDKKAAYDATLRAKLEKQKPPAPPLTASSGVPSEIASRIDERPPLAGRDSGQFAPPVREKLIDLPPLEQISRVTQAKPSTSIEPDLDLAPDESGPSASEPLDLLLDDPRANTVETATVQTVTDDQSPAQIAAAKALAKQAAAGQLPQKRTAAKPIGAAAPVIQPPPEGEGSLDLEGDPLNVVADMDRYPRQSTLMRHRRPAIPKFVLLAPLASILVVIGAAIWSTVRDAMESDNGKNVGQIAAQKSQPTKTSPPAAPPANFVETPPSAEPKVTTGFGSAAPNDPNLNEFGLPRGPGLSNDIRPLTNQTASANPADQNPQAKPSSGRATIPDADAQRKALTEIRRIYKDDFSKAVTIDGRKALAQKLTDEATNTQNDPVKRYVLAMQALEAAVQLCNVELASGLVHGLCLYYDLDDWQLKARTLEQLASTAKSPENRLIVANDAYALVDQALSQQRYDVAVELAATSAEMAATLRDSAFRQKIFEAHARALRMQKESGEVQAAQARLAIDPNDPKANLIVGRFLCLERDDWDGGLPHLARSSDADLSDQAQRDLSGAAQAPDQEAIADAWWDLADRRSSDTQLAKAMRTRAVFWYQRVRPDLTGFDASKADKRIGEVQGIKDAAPK